MGVFAINAIFESQKMGADNSITKVAV